MKKHLLALLLVACLCVCVLAVSANEPQTETPAKQYWSHLTVAADGLTATGYCPHCCESTDETVTWNVVDLSTTAHNNISTSGHYFLPEGGVTTVGAFQPATANMEIVLHLNGQTLKRTSDGGNNTGVIRPQATGTSTYIVDDEAQAGSVDGDWGWVINANSKASTKVVLYSGTLTTNKPTGTTQVGGTVVMSGDGNTFEMFGGTVNGSVTTRGGAIYAKQSKATAATTNVYIHGGTINGGAVTQYGGAIYLEYADATIDGGLIQGGSSSTSGGNVAVHGDGATCVMTGGTIQNGSAKYGGNVVVMQTGAEFILDGGIIKNGSASGDSNGSWGGNVGLTKVNAKFTMNGGTLDAGTTGTGKNIGVQAGVATLNGGIIKNGKTDSIRLNNSASASLKLNDVTFENSGIDPANFERILMTGKWTGNAATIEIGNFNSTINFDYTTNFDAADNVEFTVGMVLPQVTVTNAYTGTGTMWVYIDGGSRKPCVVDGTALKLGGLTAFDANGVEAPVATLGGDDTVAYYKLYADGECTLAGDAVVDMNNAVVDFKTGGNKLTVIDYRTDSGEVAKYTKFTVDNEEDLEIYGVNPLNGYQYICVKGDDGKWTSNRVRVTLDTLSIKTSECGIYYTTTIKTNANVAPYIVSYGTAVSIIEEPTANFINQTSVLYTEYDMDEAVLDAETGNLALTTRSALVANILKEGEAENGDRSEMPIYANSFMIVNTGSENIYIMADKAFNLSLNDAMEKLDAKLDTLSDEQLPVAVNFYTKWLAEGGFVDAVLPKLEEAAQA